jgi:hypothetical protein
MLPLKRILCSTDFSEASYEALKVSNELALHFSSELWLVHCDPGRTGPEGHDRKGIAHANPIKQNPS